MKVGGIEQWVTIRGEERANPVVLVLRGGPGDATNPWGHAGFRAWLKSYPIVQWDQRGAGKTLGRNGHGSASTLTIDRLVQDGVELADALRKSLSAERLVPQSSALSPAALTGRFAVPVFVIQGAEDFTTPTGLARAFVGSVEAPRKAFVTIRGGHFAVFANSTEFLKELNGVLSTIGRQALPSKRRATPGVRVDVHGDRRDRPIKRQLRGSGPVP
jgi:pimeloyl-ACP methyl ester carboxylesterase